jgi:hypothetical protein
MLFPLLARRRHYTTVCKPQGQKIVILRHDHVVLHLNNGFSHGEDRNEPSHVTTTSLDYDLTATTSDHDGDQLD